LPIRQGDASTEGLTSIGTASTTANVDGSTRGTIREVSTPNTGGRSAWSHHGRSASSSPSRSTVGIGTLAVGRVQRHVSHQGTAQMDLDGAEARWGSQLMRFEESHALALRKVERLHEAELQRLDQRVTAGETVHSRLDRRVSELSGTLKGVTDEAQWQVRRADASEARFWEMRHSLEQELRAKFGELELDLKSMASSTKLFTTGEENHKLFGQRLQRLEDLFDERFALGAETEHTTAQLSSRLQLLESWRQTEETSMFSSDGQQVPNGTDRDTHARVWEVEKRVDDLAKEVNRLVTEALGDRGWSARLEEHEVRLVGIRAKLDGQELHAVNLDERIRLEWESRMEKLRKSVEETVHQHEENVKQLEGATHRLDEMDEAIAAVRQLLQTRTGRGLGLADANEELAWAFLEKLRDEVLSLTSSVRSSEEELARISRHVPEIERVGSQTSTLTELTEALGTLHRDVARQVEVIEASRDKGHNESALEDVIARVAKLEVAAVFIRGQVNDIRYFHEGHASDPAPGHRPPAHVAATNRPPTTADSSPGDKDVAQLQQHLRDRLATMDALLNQVACGVLGPDAAAKVAAQTLGTAAKGVA